MGGTSTDVALCQHGEPTIGRETSISHFRIKVPSVNVHTVGAGGGSIAHVPELTKALRVGPQSAGADPGPASYGRGGTEPTVTDANVVLGHLPPSLLGGEMALDADAARAAVQTIADAMGLGSAEEAAEGILAIVNENMAARCASSRCSAATTRATSRSSPTAAPAAPRERGGRDHGLVPGARPTGPGPPLRDRRPRGGLPRRVRADVHPQARRRRRRGGRLDPGGARRARRNGSRRGHPGGRPPDRIHGRHALPPPGLRDPGRDRPDEVQGGSTRSRSGSTSSTSSSTGSACRAPRPRSSTSARSARGRPKPELPVGTAGDADASGAVEEHEIVFRGERLPTKIYDRAKLAPGHRFDGPAIVTEFDSTTVVLPATRRGRRQLQHPHQPEGVGETMTTITTEKPQIAEIPTGSRSIRSRSTSSRARSRARGTRWTPCSSAPR